MDKDVVILEGVDCNIWESNEALYIQITKSSDYAHNFYSRFKHTPHVQV